MKLRDLKIGTQLRLGLGIILFFAILLAAIAWVQTNIQWQQTEGLYEHPYQVRLALGDLEADILAIRSGMKELIMVQDGQELDTVLQEMEVRKADAAKQFGVLDDRYLGPRSDVSRLYDDFVKWNTIREETIRLCREGKTAEASARIKSEGVGGAHVAVFFGRLQTIDDFARNKAEEFYRDASKKNDILHYQLVGLIAVILVLSLFVVWLTLKGIKTPLTELTFVTGQFMEGRMNARSRYSSANEFGKLSASFNSMADAIQTQMQITTSEAQLAGTMLRGDDVHIFCREMLEALLQYTGSQMGAVYFLNEAGTTFELFYSIGMRAGAQVAFSAAELEGKLGKALVARRIQHITDIPADTHFTFAAASGSLMPREILIIPILSEHGVSAVISLASVHTYAAQTIQLVNNIWNVLTARVNGVLAFRKIKELAEQLEGKNRKLDAQRQALAEQVAEVAKLNTGKESQKR
jgi:methyl-accepting chemotaxis protein